MTEKRFIATFDLPGTKNWDWIVICAASKKAALETANKWWEIKDNEIPRILYKELISYTEAKKSKFTSGFRIFPEYQMAERTWG